MKVCLLLSTSPSLQSFLDDFSLRGYPRLSVLVASVGKDSFSKITFQFFPSVLAVLILWSGAFVLYTLMIFSSIGSDLEVIS